MTKLYIDCSNRKFCMPFCIVPLVIPVALIVMEGINLSICRITSTEEIVSELTVCGLCTLLPSCYAFDTHIHMLFVAARNLFCFVVLFVFLSEVACGETYNELTSAACCFRSIICAYAVFDTAHGYLCVLQHCG